MIPIGRGNETRFQPWHYSFSTKPKKLHSYTLFEAQSACDFSALLHDIGMYISSGKKHHKKTREILLSGPISTGGLVPIEETFMIAIFLMRYTAKGPPTNGIKRFKKLSKHIAR